MKGRALPEAQEVVIGLKEGDGIYNRVSGRGSWGRWHLRMALTNEQDFREEDTLQATGTICTKAQRRTATVGPLRVGGTPSSSPPL